MGEMVKGTLEAYSIDEFSSGIKRPVERWIWQIEGTNKNFVVMARNSYDSRELAEKDGEHIADLLNIDIEDE